VQFQFDDYELDDRAFELRLRGTPCSLEPQVFDVLSYLVQNHDRIVPRQEMLDHIWPDHFISEAALNSRLMAARRAIGDNGKDQRLIKTIHGRGFRFVGEVRSYDSAQATPPGPAEPAALSSSLPSWEVPGIRYARTSDGFHIAYSVSGSGPPLVRALGWFTHLEREWRWEKGRRFWERLCQNHSLVRYDGRGIGLSDSTTDFSPRSRLLDLETVVDALGLERFALLGMSEGVYTAVHYAAAHPERVSHLICYGGGPGGDDPDENRSWREQWSALVRVIRVGWGNDNPIFQQMIARLFLGPGAPEEDIAYFVEMQRASAAPTTAIQYLRTMVDDGVLESAARVQAPAIVVQRRQDQVMPFSRARRLAAAIPGARLIPLDGENHWLVLDDPGAPEFVRLIEAFTGAG
jgi:pimeloyl-ACP methyl ester carboxylesterase/DNA-binding winged helix-turn-helix (wHTH) protein